MPILIRHLNDLPSELNASVVTIGNFDGMHLGHRALIAKTVALAKQLGLPSVLLTFEPQPNEFFAKNKPTARLMCLREKLIALAPLGIDYVLSLRFDAEFAALSAENFIQFILCERLKAKAVVVGDDFRFGQKRQGDFNFLKNHGEQAGFASLELATQSLDGNRISSTRIREMLWAGDFVGAEKLLGAPYTMSGRIVHGDGRGRTMGYPTANINLYRHGLPLCGIFAVKIQGLGQLYYGAANVGTRPTFESNKTLLETYIFDFNQWIYGQHLSIEFCKKLRDEQRFDSIETLIAQMDQDVAQAKALFGKHCG